MNDLHSAARPGSPGHQPLILGLRCGLAARRLQQRGTALAGVPLNFRWVKAAAAIGVGSMIVVIALASPVEVLELALLVGLSAVLYLAQARGRLARDSP